MRYHNKETVSLSEDNVQVGGSVLPPLDRCRLNGKPVPCGFANGRIMQQMGRVG